MTNRLTIFQKIRKGLSYVYYPYKKLFKSSETFEFQGKKYNYFFHLYNATWRSERAVEVPIVMEIVKNNLGKEILELGNVLSHYFPFEHDILDKYDKSKKVIRQDVEDFKPTKKYDLIVSISTIEHIGWDESPRDNTKIEKSINVLKNCLNPNGKIVITFPQGYNSVLDELDKREKLQFTKKYCLVRLSRNNLWKEIPWSKNCNKKFGKPYNNANAIIVGIINV
ncbi:MAG: hypothetical protein U9P70_04910 [Patescibacteria group bacterium]|nr:hypothetical protein [Patescibacteria group bacterium]